MNGLFLFLARDAIAAFGWRVPVLIGLMVLSGVLDGLAVAALLPLLSQLGDGGAQDTQSVGGVVEALQWVPLVLGLPEGPIGIGMLMVMLVIASAVAYLAMARLAASLQVAYVLMWQTSVFSASLSSGPMFLDDQRGGDIVSAIVAEVNRVGGAFYHGCLVLSAFINLLIYSAIALSVSPITTLVVMVLGGGLFLVTRRFMRRAFRLGKDITSAQADIQSFAAEGIMAAKILKANVAEEAAHARFSQSAERLAEANFSSAFDVHKARAVFEFGGAAGLAGLLVGGPAFAEH